MYTKTQWDSKRLAKHSLRPGIGTIPNACNIYFYVYKATSWIIKKLMEIFFMPPKVLFSFPECTVRKHQLLTATSFPDELPSSELQLPSPRLATSSLNIEQNECAFFKQPFYAAPLKGHHLNKQQGKNAGCILSHWEKRFWNYHVPNKFFYTNLQGRFLVWGSFTL